MVRDDQEPGLGPAAHFIQQIAEPGHVGIVQRRVHLVEHADRRRVRKEHRKDQRHRRQRLLTPGQQRQGRKLFARRLTHDFQPGFQRIVAFDHDQIGLATAEQVLEEHREIAVHLLERRQQPFAALAVKAGNA